MASIAFGSAREPSQFSVGICGEPGMSGPAPVVPTAIAGASGP
jgi:hypothetical protein